MVFKDYWSAGFNQAVEQPSGVATVVSPELDLQ